MTPPIFTFFAFDRHIKNPKRNETKNNNNNKGNTITTTIMNHYGDYFGMEEAWEQDLPNNSKRNSAARTTSAAASHPIGNTMTNHYGDYFGLELDELVQQKETMKRIASDPSPDWAEAVQATENLPTAMSQK